MSTHTEKPTTTIPDEEGHKVPATNEESRESSPVLLQRVRVFLSTSRNRWVALAIVLMAIALTAFLLVRRTSVTDQEAAPPAAANPTGTVKFLMEQQWLIRMKLAKAERQWVARQITSTGRVIPAAHNQAVVAPPVGGIISTGQLPRVGQQVARGQVLAVLNQRPTAAESAQIAAGNAQLRIEQARIDAERRRLGQAANEAQVRLNQAKTEYERAQRLYERKAYSLRQLQAAEADYKAAQANYAAATEQLKALSDGPAARLGSVGVQTSYAVRAPISGIVVKVSKAMGEQVAPGEQIVEIINLDTVWVEAPIFERDLSYLSRRAKPVFTTPAYPGVEFTGAIVDIGAVIDERSRATTVTFEVSNRDRTLRIGMQANVRIDAGEGGDAVVIPKEAVLEHEGKKIVYVLLSGEEFQRREVAIGDELGDKVAVLSGIEPGERVVTQGAYQLKLQELKPADAGAHSHET
ncbi:MAG TPA: efflux RND transporter periplasmic adaptor subunit [Blastocatellia bacterium]|nr:efflux RND transporter periplasmic adaptor subunit [Blastocatellia bacterium]